jgi:hypothetical protein
MPTIIHMASAQLNGYQAVFTFRGTRRAAHRLRSRHRRIAVVAAANLWSSIMSPQTVTDSQPGADDRGGRQTASRAVGFSR